MVAPMAGTLYRKPAPGEPMFVSEGDKVTVGQTICIVEVRATCICSDRLGGEAFDSSHTFPC